MTRKHAVVVLPGKAGEWRVVFKATQDQIDAMRADGITVEIEQRPWWQFWSR